MSKTYTIEVPLSLDDIQLHKYQKYLKMLSENQDSEDDSFIKLKLLNIFCGITMKEAYELPISQFDSIIDHLIKLLNEKSVLHHRFTMTDPKGKTIEFGFIPNLDKMTLGEYIDAENYMSDWDEMHKAMAVLYRPIISGNKDFYKIEKYEGSDKYSEIMKDAPASVAIGTMLFFWSLGTDLLKITMDSLLKQQETLKEDPTHKDSVKNGDGISQFTALQEEMSSKLTKLQDLMSTKQ
jgi:hypothetical protein